ncbi:hypothetical protein CKM354_001115300 [Cercospora kikuchii]|uniref:Uncharacterized protein n=1 Tax=Cercospora kikuchii TaxID=84275 RepID=A0A9P3FHT6_9PEZI|nr:uncharacterized protein CKM354_001115300 [Cercospora kikuchii]GIZ48078.1 hypothetical protein CKM354_001115300 [Cercospora kikuchii]
MKAYSALVAIAGMVTAVVARPAKADPAAIKRQAPPGPYGYPPPGYGLPTSSGISGPVASTSAAESTGATEVSPIGASDSSSALGFTPSFSSLPRTGGPLTTSTTTRYFTESIVWPFPISTSVSSTEGSPVTPESSSSSSFWYGNSSSTAFVGPTGTGAASPTSTFTSRSTTTVTRETTIYLSPVPTGTAPTGGFTEGSPVGASSSPYFGNGTSSSTALAGPTASNGFWPTGSPSTYEGLSTTLPWSGYPSSSGGIEVSPTDATETTDSFSTTSLSVSYGTGISSSSSSSDDSSTEVSPVTGSESSTSTSFGFVTSTTRAWGAPLPYGPQSTTYGGPEAYGAYGQNGGGGRGPGGWVWWGWRGE